MNLEFDSKLEMRFFNAQALTDLADNLKKAVGNSLTLSNALENWYHLVERHEKLQTEYNKMKTSFSSLTSSFNVFLPDSALEIFGLTCESLRDSNAKVLFPALRAWCGFVEWSEKGEKAGFEKEFKKVDNELLALRDDERLERIRSNIEKNVRDVISRNIRAPYEVSWRGKGESFSEDKHHAKTSSGTIITFVENALITLDGSVKEKATVETGTREPESILPNMPEPNYV